MKNKAENKRKTLVVVRSYYLEFAVSLLTDYELIFNCDHSFFHQPLFIIETRGLASHLGAWRIVLVEFQLQRKKLSSEYSVSKDRLT